jgi:hypothetical protein
MEREVSDELPPWPYETWDADEHDMVVRIAALDARLRVAVEALHNLLSEFGEPVYMHHRRKYGEYQICPDAIDAARDALDRIGPLPGEKP